MTSRISLTYIDEVPHTFISDSLLHLRGLHPGQVSGSFPIEGGDIGTEVAVKIIDFSPFFGPLCPGCW